MPRTGLNWTPAGYLPAPLPARFISEAEQAAAALPPAIKAQSLKNALLRGGAKPVELEYAGIDDFIASRQGQSVPSQEVLDHIKAQGPLGQLKRVEQRSGKYGPPDLGEDSPLTREEMEEFGIAPRLPAYAPSMRKPFDPETASELTQYHEYTVPGKRGDFTGYREVLIEDPKNRAGKRSLVGENQGAVNAHASDYWARYNEYPDRVAVQNIQSDAGQDFSKGAKGEDDAAALNNRLRETRSHRQSLLNELNNNDSLPPALKQEYTEQIDGLNEEEGEIFRTAQGRFAMEFDQNGDEYFTGAAITSPLARDDNWKNLMARHIALQSIAGGGKPITIPTGKQMVDVEGFGMGTHGDSGRAAKSATAYNADLVRRLQKIFRGLDPSGAEVKASPPVEPLVTSISPQEARIQDKRFFNAQLGPMMDLPSNMGPGDNAIWRGITSGDTRRVEKAVEDYGRAGASREAINAAMQVIQYSRLMDELRGAGVSDMPIDPAAPSDTPGWTVKPSARAVRTALEKGLPIMSLAPLLLSPPQEKR